MTRWASVVYGRTAASDTWWRAVPEGLDETGWLSTVVHAAVSGGHELNRRPRFMLAQNPACRIIGVACQAGDLSTDMRSDGHRELFSFVGWMASRTGNSDPGGPELEELERSYKRWAGPVYTRIVARVWNAPPTAYCPPEQTLPEPAPWAPVARDRKPGPDPGEGLWPEESWPALWAAARAARAPLICVVGWQRASSARSDDATHLGAADAPSRPLPLTSARRRQEPVATPRLPQPVNAPRAPKPALPANSSAELDNAGPDEASAKRSLRPGRLPISAKLGVAALGGAVIGVAVTIAIAKGAATPTAAPPPPPITFQVTLPASAKPTPGSLVQYHGGTGRTVSPGQSAARIAAWPGGSAIRAAGCAKALGTAPTGKQVNAHRGLKICVELKGQPKLYGVIEITAVTPASAMATATIWP